MRNRLTYRSLIQVLGSIAALLFGSLKIFKITIIVFGTPLAPDDVQTLIGLGAGVLTALAPIRFPNALSNEPIFPRDETSSTGAKPTVRQVMLDKVEQYWVKSYLDRVLNEMTALKLDMKFVEPDKILLRTGMESVRLPDSSGVHKAFVDLGRKFVILGEPGAGKTVTLVQLARDLVIEARNDSKKPIPIILSLSSWAAEQLPFEEWLRREVREKYNLSKRVADALVLGERLLYLLDGLDEVAEFQRNACLLSIKQFVEIDRSVNYVICCRRKEYSELAIKLNIPGQVVLQPLTETQIDHYLRGKEFLGLRTLKSRNKIIRDFTGIPFMLNTIATVTRGKTESQIRLEIEITEIVESMRNEFLAAYVNRRLGEVQNAKYHNNHETRVRLKWLAQQLIKHNQTELYIENLQPTWLAKKDSVRRFQILASLGGGIVGGCFIALLTFLSAERLVVIVGYGIMHVAGRSAFNPELGRVLALIFEPWHVVVLGLTSGLSGGLLIASVLARERIVPSDQLKWSFMNAVEAQEAIALLLMLVTLVTLLLIRANPLILVAGIACTLAIFMLLGLESGEQAKQRIYPNAGIRQSLIYALIVGIVFGTPFALLLGLTIDMVFGMTFGVFLGFFAGLAYGGVSVIQHCILRFCLAYSRRIPYWRYDHFLEYCVDLIILRKVAGGYRFTHDLMRQYLAGTAFTLDDDTPQPLR